MADMCNLSAGILETGIMQGEARGVDLLNSLYAYLLSEGMTEDMNRAIMDKAYCNELLKKYRSRLM